MHKAGIDIAKWPSRPDDLVMDPALFRLLNSLGINCVIDVGGNKGGFGQRLRALGYAGRIVSFEPSPSSLPVLTDLARRDGAWVVRPVGLSSDAGAAEIHLHAESVFDSLHAKLPDLPEQEIGRYPGFRETTTATIELSTLAIEYPEAIAGISDPRVLLKSDTQGHDLEVLAGAKGLAPEVAAVLVELSVQHIYDQQPSMTRVIDVLAAEGFTAVAFQPVTRSADDLRVIEFDGLFMRHPANS
jgi:FkbM family methyltransferase